MISQRAIDLIVEAEISSRKEYERSYHRPEWPGGSSGVTIGIGYDLGYADLNKLHRDWDGKLSTETLRAMERCLGCRGEEAHRLLPEVRGLIDVPWGTAMDVFLQRDIPEWTARVVKSIPPASKLSADCLGTLVSLAYNRGASFDMAGDRYREMRQIKAHIMNNDPQAVAGDLRSMSRLWPSMRGLRVRREAEAQMWEKGLQSTAGPPPATYAATEEPEKVLPDSPNTVAHGSAAVAAAGTATIAVKAGSSMATSTLVIIVLVGLALTVAIWFAIKQLNASPTTARQKDVP